MDSDQKSPQRKREVTIYDVADRAGVAISTVSLALRNSSRVTESTRKKVLTAARELNFTVNMMASSLAKGAIPFVAICCHLYPESLAMNSFAGIEMLTGIKERFKGTAYGICLVDWDFDHGANLVQLAEMADRRLICGTIWLSCVLNPGDIKFLQQCELPAVVTEVALPGISSISVDQHAGGLLAAERLISAGCHKIAFVGGPALLDGELSPISGRIEAFRERLGKENMPLGERHIFCAPAFSFKNGYETAGEILKRMPEVDGIFCASGDKVALGLMEGLKAAGKKVPDEIRVLGYDGIQETYYSDPPLTTVVQPLFQVGYKAADVLVAALEGRSKGTSRIVLQPWLGEGKSA